MRSIDGTLRMNLEELGAEIGEIRRTQGLSRLELADMADMHVNTVVNIERGCVDGSILAISLILIKLGCEEVEISGRGFRPLLPEGNRIGNAFPGLTTNKALMAAEIGRVVRRRRLGLGASVEEIADRAGIHRNTLGNVEKGLVAPSVATIFRIYSSLDVSRVAGSNDGISLISQ